MSRPALPLVLALVLVALALPATAHEGESLTPTVVVTGNGQVREAPDQAVIRVGVEAQAPAARDAQERVNAVAQRIAEGLRRLGIPPERVQTSELYLSPVYETPRPQPEPVEPKQPRVVAYRASNVVTVQVEKLDQVGPAVDAAIAAGANRLEGVEFRLRDDDAARRRALREAVRDARRKAEAIAAELEVALGPIVEAQEGGVSVQPRFYDRQVMAVAEMSQSTPVAPGELEVHASVTLRYRLGAATDGGR